MSVCPPYAPFFGFAGVASAMIFSTVGAAFGTAKSGIGIAGLGAFKPELIMKSSLVITPLRWLHPSGCRSGVRVHRSCAGYAIGFVGDSCVRAYVFESRVFVTMVLILIFGEVLGLYGLIVALIMNSRATEAGSCP
ncbi:V-type ATPase [Epithele typhae]|uniref:V-type ATPase n=1 Tax=Epithele typhae TaxID=378194 RepID=UPI0020077B83|nr:V-type ATPase [Epithele typhae]KAH9933110.1 V-type ATPase [Epithele typhae]